MNEPKVKKHRLISFRYLFFDIAKVTGAIPMLIWFRPKLLYENEQAKKLIRGGALLMANHINMLDPISVQVSVGYRRHHFVCMKELLNTKLKRLVFTGFHCIPIDREHFGMDSFRTITGHLECGDLVSIFPEGRIHQEDAAAFADFKSGIILMALKGKAPIIPIYTKPRNHWYERTVTVIGERIDVEKLIGQRPSMARISEVAELLRNKESELKSISEKG